MLRGLWLVLPGLLSQAPGSLQSQWEAGLAFVLASVLAPSCPSPNLGLHGLGDGVKLSETLVQGS